MTTLTEGQIELDGYVFGRTDDPVCLLRNGDTMTAVAIRDQDTEHPRADLTLFGRDYFTPPTREFLLMVSGADPDAELGRLRKAWRADGVRTSPLAVSVLRWKRYGYTYRVYGRPRDFLPVSKGVAEPDSRYVQAKFQYRDALVYLDELESITLDLVTGSISDGLVLPAILPAVMGRVNRARDGVVTVGGLAAVPFTVKITGPSIGAASDVVLYGPGWRLDFGDLALNPGQILTVDTSGVGSAKVGSTSVAGYLTRTSTLTGRLSPGTSEFRFAATDSSATTTATISWRQAALII